MDKVSWMRQCGPLCIASTMYLREHDSAASRGILKTMLHFYKFSTIDFNKYFTISNYYGKVWTTNELQHEMSNNVVCETSKASDQPAHTRSLIRAFASRLNILCLLSY